MHVHVKSIAKSNNLRGILVACLSQVVSLIKVTSNTLKPVITDSPITEQIGDRVCKLRLLVSVRIMYPSGLHGSLPAGSCLCKPECLTSTNQVLFD